MPHNIPATCDGYGKRLLIEHALSCPKGDLVLALHYDAAKEWGSLEARALVPSAISYEPKINSRTVQGERNEDRARQDDGTSEGGRVIMREVQGVGSSGRTINKLAVSARRLGQVEVTAESRADVSSHGCWKRGTTAMSEIRIVNLDTGSYLRMTP